MLLALVQRLFRPRVSRELREFQLTALIRPYTALYETDLLAGSYRFVRLLHRLSVYILKLSFPLVSCWYATCISATFAPG